MTNNNLLFLSNLRSSIITFVVIYHCGVVYQNGFENIWIVSDPIKSKSIGLIGLYANVFGMSVLFFISGYFARISLIQNNSILFIKKKIKRLLVPWLLGSITLIPIYKIIFLFSRNLPQEKWFTYFHFHNNERINSELWSDNPNQQWLWFLPILFLFQMAYVLLNKLNLLRLIKTLNSSVLYSFIFCLAYSLIFSFWNSTGWFHSIIIDFQKERLLIYFIIFLIGTLVNKLDLWDTINKPKNGQLYANIILSISISIYTLIAMNLFFNIVYPERHYFIITKHVDLLFYYTSLLLSMFSFLYIILNFYRSKLNYTNTFWLFMNRYPYQIYLIHMVIIGLFATLFKQWNIPVYIKFPVLCISSYLFSYWLIQLTNTIINTLNIHFNKKSPL